MSSRAVQKNPRAVFALFIFAFTFALRFAFAMQWQNMPYGDAPLLDAQIYDQWALAIADGHPPAHAFYQSPLYPYLLSLIYGAFGHSFLAASLLNALLDSVTATMLSLLTWHLFGRAAAILAGLLAACYGPMIFYAAPPMKEPLVLFLLTGFLCLALYSLRTNRLRDYLLTGLAFGLAVLSRGNVLLLAPVLPFFIWRQHRGTAGQGIAVFALATIVAIAPAAWHNYRAADDFVPIAYADGFNLYIGHSPYANGTNAYPPEVSTGPEQERIDTAFIAEQAAGKPLKPSEISTYWRGRAIDFALHHPVAEVELLFRKLYAFWNAGDSFDNYDVTFIKHNFPSLLNWPLVNFALLSMLASFALFAGAARRAENRFLIVCASGYMLSVVIFYVTDRYRLPIVIFLIPFAGAALPYGRDLFRAKQKTKLAVSFAASVIFLALALSPRLDAADLSAFDWGVLTTIYGDKGDSEKTLDAFHKATALSPQQAGVQTYVHAAGIYEKFGQLTQAEDLLSQAATIFPQDGVAFYNVGRLQALRGNISGAITTMQKAQRLDPAYVLTYYALAALYAKQGDIKTSQNALADGLKLDPEDPRLLNLQALQASPSQ